MNEEKNYVTSLNQSEVQPQEAAKNIENATLFDIEPDTYVELKPHFTKDVDSIEKVPKKMEEATKEFSTQSQQHRSLASNDLNKLNFIEKRVKYYKERIIDIPEMNRESVDLYNKKMEGNLSEEEEIYLKGLDKNLEQMNEEHHGVDGDGEQFFVEVLSAAGDMLRSYTDNKALIGTSIATGATLGAGIGLTIPMVGTTLVGAKVGAIGGTVTGFGLAGFWDGYKMMKGSVYKELEYARDAEGIRLAVDEDTKVAVSHAVGAIGGIAEGLSGMVLAKGNPLLKRFLSAKGAVKTLTKNPALLAKMSVLGHMAKSAAAEGGTEGLQEFIQIVGVNFAKMDDTEASFLNALENSLTKETLERVKQAGKLGAATGGFVAGVTSVPGYKGLKQRHALAQQKARDKGYVLEKQNQILEVVSTLNSTEMKDLSPGELKSFKEKIYKNFVGQEAWFTLEDLRDFADSDEKVEFINQIIDPSGELNRMSKELNTPVMLQEGDLLTLAEEYPETTDYIRLKPDGENPREVRTAAQEHVEKLKEAEAKRDAIFDSLGSEEDVTPEKVAELDALLNPEEELREINNEQDLYEDIAFEPIEGIVTKEEVEILNTKELDARIEVATNLKDKVDKKFDNTEDRILRDVNAKDEIAEVESYEREHAIIDRFNDTKNTSEAALAAKSKHSRKGRSPIAIDPKSLPEDLKVIYSDNKNLKKRKAFVKGGLHIEDAAALAGVENGTELLKILAETPSKSEILKSREQRKIALKNRIKQTTKPARNDARDKAFTKLTNSRIDQMKYLISKEWSTMKRGIIKIASKLPTVEGLNREAKSLINKTRLKDLKPSRFASGEKRSRKKATQHWLKTEFESTFKALQAAALNNELHKESLNAKEKIQKAEKFWKNLKKPRVQQTLKDAGMLKVIEEFTDVFKMTTETKGLTELKAFNKFIEQQVEEGNYTPTVPKRLEAVQESAREMTVEQYLTISEMGQFILHKARTKNKLAKIAQDRKELMTAEKIAEEIDTHAKEHVNYDEKRSESKSPKYLSVTDSWKKKLASFVTSTNSLKTIATELDEWKVNNGFFYETFAKPIKDAYTSKRLEMHEIEANDKKIVESYGLKKFQKMFNEFVEVPEFSNIPTLGDGQGNIRKIDLLTLQAYMGDPQGREAVLNFITRKNEKLPIETFQKVLDRELSEADAQLVQKLMNDRFKRFEQRSFDLHKNTTGIEPNMVKGIPVIHRGKELPGGYFPIKRQLLPDDKKAEKFLGKVKEKYNNFSGVDEDHFFARLASAEQTEQGRLKERTGSERPIDLNFENIFEFTEEAVHDLHFREVGIDALKIIKNPINVKNMKSIVGPEKFTVMLNSIKNIISKTSDQEAPIFSDESRLVNTTIGTVHHLHAVKAIGYNLNSALIQVDSLKNLTLRLGPKTALYLAKQAKKIASNPILFEEYSRLAEELNPDILLEKDGIDNTVIKESYDWIPSTQNFFKKYNSKSAQTISGIRELQRKVIDSAFYFVREGDRINKIIATLAVSEQFLNGDVEGFPLSKLEKMSDADKAKKLRGIVQQALDLSLTASSAADKSPLENNKVAKMLLRYWTDRRSGLNSSIAQIQKTKANIKRGEYAKAGKQLGTLSLAAGISAAWITAVRDGAEETIKKIKVKDEDDAKELAQDMLWHFMSSPVSQLAETIPLIDNISYSADLEIRSDYRNVSVPFFGVMSDAAMGYNVLKDVLKAARKGKMASLSDVQQKAILTNMGYLAGGAPTNSMWKLAEFMKNDASKPMRQMKRNVDELNDEINLFIEAFQDDPETAKFINDLKEYQKDIQPTPEQDATKLIPEDTKDIIKSISSEGKWNAYNSETGEAGLYQFTEERWNEIEEASSLGLTENGRVSKNTKQQELAMKWSNEDNAKNLAVFEIPVNTQTLYGAHKFGLESYVRIYNADKDEKLTKVLGEETANSPIFEKFENVNSIKAFISKRLKNAKPIDKN